MDQDSSSLRGAQRRRARLRQRAKATGRSSVFASPAMAVACMGIALTSIVAYWKGVPPWALLVLGGFGVVLALGALLYWRSQRAAPPDS
jgi:fatty acid desaturase